MTEPAAVCRICGRSIAAFMSFGLMPLANGFAHAGAADEFRFELRPAVCHSCGAFQLLSPPSPSRMFHAGYAFHSGSSQRMAAHFESLASAVIERLGAGATEGSRLVGEIGCNDGVLLGCLRAAGCRVVGVEPSANVAAVARTRGLDVVEAFFDAELGERLRHDYGPADAIVATNALSHIADVHAAVDGLVRWLAPDGVAVIEDPYLGDVIGQGAYDQIYDEHAFVFSVAAMSHLLAAHGLEIVDVVPQPTHGGSLRYVAARAGRQPACPGVSAVRARERTLGLDAPATYLAFRAQVEASRDALTSLLRSIRARGCRIAGYGATSKSTTVLNYCGIGPDLIEYICDTTPGKQGRLTPGTHIPVVPTNVLYQQPPDYAVLFAWNHAAEILAREREFASRGGRWITFVPTVAVLDETCTGDGPRPADLLPHALVRPRV